MFANAIENISKFTRSIHFISRNFGSTEVIPGTATLFFVNDEGVAITCKHVVDELLKCKTINDLYSRYKVEAEKISNDENKEIEIQKLNSSYGFDPSVTLQYHSLLYDCVEIEEEAIKFSVIKHPLYDLAIIKITNATKNLYNGHAVFAKNSMNLRRGTFLCRFGYPFPEFTNFRYNTQDDNIEWISEGRKSTPSFPIEGMFTRDVLKNGSKYAYELSTPGLKGQSGGPLFNSDGIVYGMQFQTVHLHLGFDQENVPIRINGELKQGTNYPFLHVGRCICVDVIKEFLNEHKIKYYIGDSLEDQEIVNG